MKHEFKSVLLETLGSQEDKAEFEDLREPQVLLRVGSSASGQKQASVL